ncbi:MAG: leucine-rich repeat domain-containing protein, partial [Phycisphaerae bacterium]|nr:leucine-rich repeat domain-containing protein [Saprospiraceae bacterium]
MSDLALQRIAENKKTKKPFLDLGNCGLTEVPTDILNLDWVEKLYFGNQIIINKSQWDRSSGVIDYHKENYPPNTIAIFPDFLLRLKSLNCLSIESLNLIKDFSPISKLSNLQVLNCSSTRIDDLSPLKELKNLRQLNASETLINDLAPLRGLKRLERLNLSRTRIFDLSPLSGFKNLQQLDICNTLVSDLSPILSLIKAGRQVIWHRKWDNKDKLIHVLDCPITIPPREVVERGENAILRYFDEREKVGTDQIYEAKLLLIGEGGAGKTTLCHKLFDHLSELPKEKDSTRGIDIRPLYFDLPDGKQFRINVWDFAGQGKYQAAHSFFYTHRSLYVLVDDTRTLDENEAYRTFYYHWLQTAELFGGNSPLLVLHNQKADRARTGFNLGTFQAEFPFVKELFCINLGSKDTSGILDLKKQITRWAQKLPHIGDVVPKTWVKVREDIETERQMNPYISDQRYRDICAIHGITDELKQSDLSHYFHDLGIFLHFQENALLRRDIFLQNQWVTDAVYKILDDPEISGKQRGRFDKTDLARLWDEGFYSKRRDELLALMLQFELCYQVQDTETYIAPQLLPGDIPVYDLGKDIPLQLKYEYGFMPKGLLYRLIVRIHRLIAKGQLAVWNGGAVLERLNAKADILESLDRRQISVRVTGTRAKELVTIVAEK